MRSMARVRFRAKWDAEAQYNFGSHGPADCHQNQPLNEADYEAIISEQRYCSDCGAAVYHRDGLACPTCAPRDRATPTRSPVCTCLGHPDTLPSGCARANR